MSTRTAFLTSVLALFVSTALMGAGSAAYAASIKATVDISKQRMSVFVDGRKKYTWVVSTGMRATPTPLGSYTPFALTRMQYAKQWNMHLPYVVSLDWKGTAIHGTYQTRKLGRKASHGCIRLHPRNAAIFYKLVQAHGLWNTRVSIVR